MANEYVYHLAKQAMKKGCLVMPADGVESQVDLPQDAASIIVGVLAEAVAANAWAKIQIDGVADVVAHDAVTAGQRVTAGDTGDCTPCGTAAATTYGVAGVAITDAVTAGDVFKITIAPDNWTKYAAA